MVPTQLLTALHPQKCSQLVGKVLWSSYWLEVIGPKIQIRRKPDSCPERVHENGRGTQENGWLQYKSKGDICYNIRMSIHTQKSWHVNRVLEDEWEWSTLDTKGQVMLERGQHPKWSDREEPLCHTSFCMKDSRSTHISTNDPISVLDQSDSTTHSKQPRVSVSLQTTQMYSVAYYQTYRHLERGPRV